MSSVARPDIDTTAKHSKHVRQALRSVQPMDIGTPDLPLEVVADEVLVRFHEGMSEQEEAALVRSLGSAILSRGHNSGYARLKLPKGQNLYTFLTELDSLSEIDTAHTNAVTRSASYTDDRGTAVYFDLEWNLNLLEYQNMVQLLADQVVMSDVVVAVLDTGVAYKNALINGVQYVAASDLSTSTIIPGYDFIDNDSEPLDEHMHGTHISNVIAGDVGAEGVAPGVSLMPVRVLDADAVGTELALAEGIEYAVANGADIINMSLVFGAGYYPSDLMLQAIANAKAAGVLLVAAAGNCGQDHIHYPAAFSEVIGVGATQLSPRSGTRFAKMYSDRNYHVSILAPGGNINRDANKDDVPDGILAQTIVPNDPSQTGYYLMAGTSQAAAQISGSLAWFLAAGATPEKADKYIHRTIRVTEQHVARSDRDSVVRVDGYSFGMANLYEGVRKWLEDEAAGIAGEATLVTASPSKFYVNTFVAITDKADGTQRGSAIFQVFDENGAPASRVTLVGQWFGSDDRPISATTNANGIAESYTDKYPASDALMFGVDVVAAVDYKSVDSLVPTQFYYLTEGLQEAMTPIVTDSVMADMAMIFSVPSQDPYVGGIFPLEQIAEYYYFQPIGAWDRISPVAVALNAPYMNALLATRGPAEVRETVFSHALAFGYGPTDRVSYTLYPAVNAEDTGLLVMRGDPAMLYGVPGYHTPVFCLPADEFLTMQESLFQGFAFSSLGQGSDANLLQSAFDTSTLGTGFAHSALGVGFAYSSLANGFGYSTLGTGFAYSALANGFAYSALANSSESTATSDGSSAMATAVVPVVAQADGTVSVSADTVSLSDEPAELIDPTGELSDYQASTVNQ